MSDGRSRRGLSLRIAVVAVVPALLWGGTVAVQRIARGARPEPAFAEQRVAEIRLAFRALMDEASGTAADALDDALYRVDDVARREHLTLAPRLEGILIRGAGHDEHLEWTGTPADPPPESETRIGPAWLVRRDGRRTRVLAMAGPDPDGRRAFATFLLDSELPGVRFRDLFDPALVGDIGLRLIDPTEVGGRTVPGKTYVLGAPDGTPAVTVVLEGTGATGRDEAGGPGAAIAALAFVALLAVAFPWRRLTERPAGAVAAVVAVALGRVALEIGDVPGLLPRGIGRPEVFGSSAVWGLLSSPADLLATALALYLVARVVRSRLRGADAGPTPALAAVAVVLATGATAAALGIVVELADDARIRVLAPDGGVSSLTVAVLLAGLGLALLAPAELWGAAWDSRGPRPGARGAGRVAVAVALVPLAALAAALLLAEYDRLGRARLRSEFAPLVLEQSARRRIALVSAMEYAAGPATRRLEAGRPGPHAATNLAYDLWVHGALAQTGFKSSLTLYDADGVALGHFGFDVPELDEEVDPRAIPADRVRIREEPFQPIATVRQRLIHAEVALTSGDRVLGLLVGHVLDEPDDLPFLPGVRAYLRHLGPVPAGTPEDAAGTPEYVVYSPYGSVRSQTLGQAPAWTYAFEKAALEGRTVRVDVGGDPYVALPLVETTRLHLLLLPAPTFLERAGTFVRVLLVALAVLALATLAGVVLRRGGLARLATGLRRSYYRKLLVTLLLASVLPTIGLSLLLRGYLAARGEAVAIDSASQLAKVAQRVVEDYSESQSDAQSLVLPDDALLYWLRRLVGQDIHLYENGTLLASSKRELFDAGLLLPRLPSDVHLRVIQQNRPVVVVPERLGGLTVPVAYAPVNLERGGRRLVVAVPIVLHQPEIRRAVDRMAESLLLGTFLLAVLLTAAAAWMARVVVRPVRALVRASGRIASGDYTTRLESGSEDELAEATRGFNAMVAALASQRADLERRRDYMEALLRNATTGVVSTDPEGRIVTLNPAAQDLLRGPDGPPRGGRPLVAEVARVRGLEPLARALDALPPSTEGLDVDLPAGDTVRRLRLVRAALPDPSGGLPGALLLLEDVTDLMRRNQLEAWAEMARAIAHEIKNPLTPIQLSTEHLERLLRDRGALPSSEIETCLETVMKQVRALREIAGEFSAYAKLPVLAPAPVDPSAFLAETIRPYRDAPPDGVEVVESYGVCPAVPIDRRVLSRAVVNLVENALHAMPRGGELRVETAIVDDGRRVRMTIADTGSGIGSDVRARLFEPYFSTKSAGTGLGLAIVRRSVEAHGGSIELETAEGRGTRFHLLLPVVPPAEPGRDIDPPRRSSL